MQAIVCHLPQRTIVAYMHIITVYVLSCMYNVHVNKYLQLDILKSNHHKTLPNDQTNLSVLPFICMHMKKAIIVYIVA